MEKHCQVRVTVLEPMHLGRAHKRLNYREPGRQRYVGHPYVHPEILDRFAPEGRIEKGVKQFWAEAIIPDVGLAHPPAV